MTKFMDASRGAQYHDFFCKPAGGRRHMLGAASTIDEIIMGRDMDHSGPDPHAMSMSKFHDHAGLKSGAKTERVRKPGYAMVSTTDSVVWGRDFDKSGVDPHDAFLTKHAEHAGCTTVEKEHRPVRKHGYAMASVMDSVIWGRDFDKSGDPKALFEQTYAGCAGGPTGYTLERPRKKILKGTSASVDEIFTGRDFDRSEDTHAAFFAAHSEHAGTRSGETLEKPSRTRGVSLKGSAVSVIWGRDVDQSNDIDHKELFETKFGNCAGAVSGGETWRRSVRNAAERAKLAQSTPDLASKSLQPGSFSFKPSDRRSFNGSQTARAPQKALGRRPSTGSLTSRDSGVQCGNSQCGRSGQHSYPPKVEEPPPTETVFFSRSAVNPPITKSGTRSQCSTASSSAGSKPRWQ